jgi:hypothetical protein
MEEGYSTLETPKSGPIFQTRSYAAGRPWAAENIKTVNLPKYIIKHLHRLRMEGSVARQKYAQYEQAQEASKVTPKSRGCKQAKNTPPMKIPPFPDAASRLIQHLKIIGSTSSSRDGWISYVFLVHFISGSADVRRHVQHIPFAYLHRLTRLLARNRPYTRRQFLQLLAVLTYLNYWKGEIKKYEWDTLVTHAGARWRKVKLENVKDVMRVFNDMRAGRLPSSSDVPPAGEGIPGRTAS